MSADQDPKSHPGRFFPVRPNLHQIKIQAKELLRDFKRGEAEAPQAEEQEEGGVMGYMTEQVSRDSYNVKKTGQYVDRGFKKPVNYAHWLHING